MGAQRHVSMVNLALVAIAVLTAALVWFTRHSVTSSELAARKDNLFSAWREQALKMLVLERSNQRIELEHSVTPQSDTWILEPGNETADDGAVHQLLGQLELSTWVRQLEQQTTDARDALGLLSPELVVSIDMGNLGYRLLIGKPARSPEGAHYAEVSAGGASEPAVGIASRELVEQLERAFDNLRGRKLLLEPVGDIERVSFTTEDGSLNVERAGAIWRFVDPHKGTRVDRRRLEQNLLELSETVAEKFVPYERAKPYLSRPPQAKIELFAKSKARTLLVFGGTCPEKQELLLAVRERPRPFAGCVSKDVLRLVPRRADDYLDRFVVWAHSDEVETVRITEAGHSLKLRRVENGFELLGTRTSQIALETGNQRLDAITAAQGKLVQPPPQTRKQLEHSSHEVSIEAVARDGDQTLHEDLKLLPERDGALVLRLSDQRVLKIDTEAYRSFLADTTLLKSLELLDFKSNQLVQLELETSAARQKLSRDAAGNLSLSEPAGYEVDGRLLEELFDAVSKLRAQRWVSDTDDGSFGLDKPRIMLKFAIRSHDHKVFDSLRVGRAAPTGYYASLKSKPGVFVLDKSTVNTLATLVLDRSSLMLDPESVSVIELESQAKKIVLERRTNRRYTQTQGPALTVEQIQQLIEELSSLRVEAAIRLGGVRASEGLSPPRFSVRYISDSPSESRQLFFGASDLWRDMGIVYAKSASNAAVYVVLRSKLLGVKNALGID